MAKTVKNIDGITRPFYDRQPQDRRHFVAMPRFNEYPPPNDELFGECGKLNDLWRPHVNGVLSILLDEDLWAGEQWQKERAVQLMFILMEWLFDCEDDDMQLRQSETDPCVLEQLINGVWVTAFDYGLCLKATTPSVSKDVIVDNLPAIEAGAQAVYDDILANGVTTEFPLTDNSPSDPLNSPKNAVLCATTREYITRLIDFVEQMAITNSQPNPPNFGQVIADFALTAGSGWALAGLLAPYTGGLSLLWVNIARVGAGATTLVNAGRTVNSTANLIGDLRSAFFDTGKTIVEIDDDTRNEIICILYDNLKDKPLTQANFNAALQAIPEATSVEQALKNVVIWLFMTNVTYAEFVVVYNQMLVAQQTGMEYTDNDCGCTEPPLDCGINYNWLLQDSSPPDVTFYESVPANAVPVQIAYVPAIPVQPASPFVANQFVSVYQVYESPCNLPISATWWRANTNSASAVIETYDGIEWTVRATTAISVGTVSGFRVNMSWSNPTDITYQGCRVRVTSAAPRIDTFIIG